MAPMPASALDGNLWGYSVFITFFLHRRRQVLLDHHREALDLCQPHGIEETGAPGLLRRVWRPGTTPSWNGGKEGLFARGRGSTFAPEANMTYAEFLTVSSASSPGGDPHPVTGGAWYDTYVQWAQPLIPEGMKAL